MYDGTKLLDKPGINLAFLTEQWWLLMKNASGESLRR